jgi:hypothetical protein
VGEADAGAGDATVGALAGAAEDAGAVAD